MEENTARKALEPVEEMLDRLTVQSIFGPPTTEGETTIIPVADLMYGFGYGFGGDAEGGEGAGGGGGGKATPRGYIRITPGGVSYVPTNNDTLIAVGGMLTGVWVIFWIALTIRSLIKAMARNS